MVERALKVATPELALAELPVKVAVGVEANETVALEGVTMLPKLSSTSTANELDVPPAVKLDGCVAKTSWLAAAALTVKLAEVAVASAPEDAVTV